MIVAVTGHRPQKLGGYSTGVNMKLLDLAQQALKRHNIEKVLTGMAQGWDQAIATSCAVLNIPFVACIPFTGQDEMWTADGKRLYQFLMEKASEVKLVSNGSYSPTKMQKRNEYMVDNSEFLIALWNGTPGGTANCIAYAKKVGRKGENWWPKYK